MVNFDLLRIKIEESGMPITTISRRSNMNVYTLHNKLNGKTDFKLEEAKSLSETLRLSVKERDDIFFAN